MARVAVYPRHRGESEGYPMSSPEGFRIQPHAAGSAAAAQLPQEVFAGNDIGLLSLRYQRI